MQWFDLSNVKRMDVLATMDKLTQMIDKSLLVPASSFAKHLDQRIPEARLRQPTFGNLQIKSR